MRELPLRIEHLQVSGPAIWIPLLDPLFNTKSLDYKVLSTTKDDLGDELMPGLECQVEKPQEKLRFDASET